MSAEGRPSREPRSCTVLYKILTPSEKQILPAEAWQGTDLDTKDGFIHLSTSQQLPGTLERFFSSRSGLGDDLYILALPRPKIDESTLRFDPAAGTEFGHVYGTIDPSQQFSSVHHIKRDPKSGTFPLPQLQF